MARPDKPTITYPGARRPDRTRVVDAHGVKIAVYEWGDEDSPPIFLAHGGMDFAATWDLLAPKLADAGWRPVAWDQRGHGDSDHTALYSFEADVRDALAVMDSVTRSPAPVIGHSKGAMVFMQLTEAVPHRVELLVNIDGIPGKAPKRDVIDYERGRFTAADVSSWLDHRRAANLAVRKPGTLEELARRRQLLNPRLDLKWLRYIAAIGGFEDDDGWRWKLDPLFRFGGFGPWRPLWAQLRMASLPVPMLGIMSTEPDAMGWGSEYDDVVAMMPAVHRLERYEGVGHFVQIEAPQRTAEDIFAFVEEHHVA
ncbi:MAG: alpha/beta fold hydrolase [Acidimicrobiia bacterium]